MKIQLFIAVILLTLSTFGQTQFKKFDTIYLDTKPVGVISGIHLDTKPIGAISDITGFDTSQIIVKRSEDDPTDTTILVSYLNAIDVKLISPITRSEKKQLEKTYRTFNSVTYDFNFSSDYIKQSTTFRQMALYIILTTRLIGYGTGVAGVCLVFNYHPTLGLVTSTVGLVTVIVGEIVSLNLNFKSNDMMRKSSEKLRQKGF